MDLYPKYIKNIYNSTIKKNPIFKWAKGMKTVSPKKVYKKANNHSEKMLNIISHDSNANQNRNEIPLHIYQDGYNQKDRHNN